MIDLKDVKYLAPCKHCKSSGFTDCVNRDVFAMEPKNLLCGVCGGRGWCLPELNLTINRIKGDRDGLT